MDFLGLDWDMGKYGLFVWGSYGLSFIAIGSLVWLSLRVHAQRKKVLEALQQATAPSEKSDA